MTQYLCILLFLITLSAHAYDLNSFSPVDHQTDYSSISSNGVSSMNQTKKTTQSALYDKMQSIDTYGGLRTNYSTKTYSINKISNHSINFYYSKFFDNETATDTTLGNSKTDFDKTSYRNIYSIGFTSQSKKYLSNNEYGYYNIKLSPILIHNNLSKTNISYSKKDSTNNNSKIFGLASLNKLDLSVGIGRGRINDISPAKTAHAIYTALSEINLLNHSPTSNSINQLANVILLAQSETIFDSREKEKHILKQVDTHLHSKDLIQEFTILYYSSLADILFQPNNIRYSGTSHTAMISGSGDLFLSLDKEETKSKTNANDSSYNKTRDFERTTHGSFMLEYFYQHHTALNPNWQWGIEILYRSGFFAEKHYQNLPSNIKTKNFTYSKGQNNSIKAISSISYYPNTYSILSNTTETDLEYTRGSSRPDPTKQITPFSDKRFIIQNSTSFEYYISNRFLISSSIKLHYVWESFISNIRAVDRNIFGLFSDNRFLLSPPYVSSGHFPALTSYEDQQYIDIIISLGATYNIF